MSADEVAGAVTKVARRRVWRATVAYDGTEFAGFQVQAKQRVRTVQGELEKALNRLTGEAVRAVGASRTDAGVHALAQVVRFATSARIPADRWAAALNSVLPEDVRVVAVTEAVEGFHPRFDSRRKVYRYVIANGPGTLGAVLWRRYAWQIRGVLDVEAMREAAGALMGKHDFASFRAAGSSVKSTVRTVSEARWDAAPLGDGDLVPGLPGGMAEWGAAGPDALARPDEWGRLLIFFIAADGFLYNMVRNIVGTMVEVGRGKRRALDVEALLEARDRRLAGPTAPAHALCLVRVEF